MPHMQHLRRRLSQPSEAAKGYFSRLPEIRLPGDNSPRAAVNILVLWLLQQLPWWGICSTMLWAKRNFQFVS